MLSICNLANQSVPTLRGLWIKRHQDTSCKKSEQNVTVIIYFLLFCKSLYLRLLDIVAADWAWITKAWFSNGGWDQRLFYD